MVYKDKDATSVASIIYEMNQIMKNAKSSSEYVIIDGASYAYKEEYEDIMHNRMEYSVLNNKLKKKYEDDIKNINGKVNGKEFYQWMKEYKSHITEVILGDYDFVINTSHPEITFKSDRYESNNDSEKLAAYLKRNLYPTKEPVYHDEAFETVIEEHNGLKGIIIPFTCTFKFVNKKNVKRRIKFRITKKLFLAYNKECKVDLAIYPVNIKSKVYMITYTITNKNYRISNYATIVNY